MGNGPGSEAPTKESKCRLLKAFEDLQEAEKGTLTVVNTSSFMSDHALSCEGVSDVAPIEASGASSSNEGTGQESSGAWRANGGTVQKKALVVLLGCVVASRPVLV